MPKATSDLEYRARVRHVYAGLDLDAVRAKHAAGEEVRAVCGWVRPPHSPFLDDEADRCLYCLEATGKAIVCRR